MPSGEGSTRGPSSLRAGADSIALTLEQMQRLQAPVESCEVAGLVQCLDRILNQTQALKLKVVAGEAAFAAATDAGFRDTGSWLAKQTRTTSADAVRQVRLAEQLETATRTGAALAGGEISADHAAVVTGALRQLPEQLTGPERDKVEDRLLRNAATMDPAQLRKAARRALEAVEPDPVVVDAHENGLLEAEEERARAKTRLTWHHNGDGTMAIHAVVPTLAGEFLAKVIHTMTAPRRNPVTGHTEQVPGDTDWGHRRGLAFLSLLERLPSDQLHPKTAATLVVQIRHDVLTGALAAAGVETGSPISAATARRLACEAAIIPTVLGGATLPLDLGRQQRLHTTNQRIALSTRHTTCAHPGCTVPFAWCEIHHPDPWSKGGKTDLANAVPLCSFHHHLAHRTDPKVWTGPAPDQKPKSKPVRIPQQRRAPART